MGCTPKKGGWDTGAGRSNAIHPTRKILIENPLPGFAAWKNSTKRVFNEFISLEKCAQPLLIEHIWQSQKFNKPSYYQNFFIGLTPGACTIKNFTAII
jgi:hypothetical protein